MEVENGTGINYRISGDAKKPALVFLHFFGGSLHTWDVLIALLEKEFYCVALDLPGFGASAIKESYLKVADSAKKVAALLEQLGIHNYTIIGHSMGGKIALFLASQHIPNLEQLVLVAPSPPTPEQGTDQSRSELLDTFSNPEKLKKLINKLIYKPLPDPVFQEVLNEHMQVSKTGWDGWIKKGSQEDISSLMKNVSVPVNVICSADDPNFPPSLLKPVFNKYLPLVNFIEMNKTGHLIPVEIPEKLDLELRKILS